VAKLSISVKVGQHESVSTSRLVITGRPSILARLQTRGLTLYAEATPLPGFGSDDIERAEAGLREFTAEEIVRASAEAAAAFNPDRTGLLSGPDDPAAVVHRQIGRCRSPSARFAVETLILGAAAGACGVPIWRLLAAECVAQELPTSTVIDPFSPQVRSHMQAEIARGIRTFKVKCGRDDQREIETIHELIENCEEVRLRLDPNQAWTVGQAVQFIEACPRKAIDWVEDPTPEPAEWFRIRDATGVTIAIDEPLSGEPSESQIGSMSPDVLVLKPMALGGAFTCLRLARWSKEQGFRVSVSHLFDGRAAMSATIQLAFAVQSRGITPGLGRHVALEGGHDEAPFPPELTAQHLTCPVAARASASS
jgi:o-succinylbenzoate synthase